MPNYVALKTEIAKPAYNGMSDVQICAAINAASGSPIDRDNVAGGELVSALVRSEVNALAAADRSYVQTVCAAQTIPLTANFKTELGAVFGAGTATRTNLLALLKSTQTLANQFGFARPIDVADLIEARKN